MPERVEVDRSDDADRDQRHLRGVADAEPDDEERHEREAGNIRSAWNGTSMMPSPVRNRPDSVPATSPSEPPPDRPGRVMPSGWSTPDRCAPAPRRHPTQRSDRGCCRATSAPPTPIAGMRPAAQPGAAPGDTHETAIGRRVRRPRRPARSSRSSRSSTASTGPSTRPTTVVQEANDVWVQPGRMGGHRPAPLARAAVRPFGWTTRPHPCKPDYFDHLYGAFSSGCP